ncbi:MAG: cytochrome c [Rhizobiaceae bacterium]
MKFFAIAASAFLIGVTAASADPIEDRQALMKERGAQMQVLVPMAQEKQPFDAAAAMAALETLAANAASVDVEALWPEGSMGGENDTAPAAWENWDDFVAAHDKFKADAEAAVAANPQDLDTFKGVFGSVAANCGSCHQTFRL